MRSVPGMGHFVFLVSLEAVAMASEQLLLHFQPSSGCTPGMSPSRPPSRRHGSFLASSHRLATLAPNARFPLLPLYFGDRIGTCYNGTPHAHILFPGPYPCTVTPWGFFHHTVVIFFLTDHPWTGNGAFELL